MKIQTRDNVINMYDVSAIKNYILFLRTRFNLSVTVHSKEYYSIFQTKDLMIFNIHDNPYCLFLKSCKKAREHCVNKQTKVLDKCINGPYEGTCYAGVKEYVYPIKYENKNIGFISVGGYKTEGSEGYISAVAKKYSISITELEKYYKNLKNFPTSKNEIDILIKPLCDMFELALIKCKNVVLKEVPFALKITRYIKQYHNQPITSDDICRDLACSRSYMSAEFNKHMGKTIREYINELRITDAKFLLEYSKNNISEIAFSVGFTDANYFSSIFKKNVGVSPFAYRKANRK